MVTKQPGQANEIKSQCVTQDVGHWPESKRCGLGSLLKSVHHKECVAHVCVFVCD